MLESSCLYLHTRCLDLDHEQGNFSSFFRVHIPQQLRCCVQVHQWEAQAGHCCTLSWWRGNGQFENIYCVISKHLFMFLAILSCPGLQYTIQCSLICTCCASCAAVLGKTDSILLKLSDGTHIVLLCLRVRGWWESGLTFSLMRSSIQTMHSSHNQQMVGNILTVVLQCADY